MNARTLDLSNYVAAREPKFLSENLVISSPGSKGPRYTFIFERGRGDEVRQIVEYLNQRLSAARPPEAAVPA